MRGKSLFQRCLEHLIKGADEYIRKFDPASGKFLEENGGWSPYQQDYMYPLALLYKTPYPSNPYYGDAKIKRMVEKAGDAYRDFQNPDGTVEFVKVDGSRWGAAYLPWAQYHWLETLALMKDELDAARLRRWEEGLRLAYEGVHKEIQNREVHNIPAFHAMALIRASHLLNEPSWLPAAEQMIRNVLDCQHPDGYWPENGGPTTLYNTIYTQALGLYHFHGGSQNVVPALERAVRFHTVFAYPDGTGVETVDGRVKYHDEPNPRMAGFLINDSGRSFIRHVVEQAESIGANLSSPWLASVVAHARRVPDAPEEGLEQSEVTALCNSLMIRKHGWAVCMSGFTAPSVDARWYMDRQSFISVWHSSARLIVGGGHSKNQPDWSTFVVEQPDGSIIHIPDSGRTDPEGERVRLVYGGVEASIRVESVMDKELRIRFEAGPRTGGKLRVNVPLRLTDRAFIATDKHELLKLSERDLHLSGEAGAHWLETFRYRISWEGAYRLTWPSRPFNPYAADGAASLDEAVALLSFPLEDGDFGRTITVAVK